MAKINATAENIVLKQQLLDFEHPIGSVWVGGKDESDTPLNPTDIFGGEWKLIDKEFQSKAINDTAGNEALLTVSGYITSYDVYAIYSGHTIRLRIGFTPNIALNSDDTVAIGTLNFNNLGISSLYHSLLGVPALSDASNGLVMCNIENSGAIYVNDIVKATTADKRIYINQELTIRFNNMANSFCDKFYWERTE